MTCVPSVSTLFSPTASTTGFFPSCCALSGFSAPHTLNPDKAQQLGKKPVVEAVGEKRVLTDGTHVIELYHLQNFGHHDGMLIAYLPKEKVLLEADGYNPQPATA